MFIDWELVKGCGIARPMVHEEEREQLKIHVPKLREFLTRHENHLLEYRPRRAAAEIAARKSQIENPNAYTEDVWRSNVWNWLVKCCESSIEDTKKQIATCQSRLDELEGMEPRKFKVGKRTLGGWWVTDPT